MTRLARILAGLAAAISLPAVATAAEHRIGFGYHYWATVDDIDVGDLKVDDKGSAAVASYQYLPGGFLRFEADLEYFSGGYGGSTGSAYSPQVYVLVGRFIYGGVGVGITHSTGFESGGDWSDPWYAARIGLDLSLLPRIHLDINANYRANAFSELRDAETDAVTFGASVRLSF